jgi:hypothetical protein
MGVDTVKLSYPLKRSEYGWRWVDESLRRGWSRTKKFGTMGVSWWCERVHEDGTLVRVKGVGEDAYLLWEGSVPKFLGVAGAADPDLVRMVDRHVRRVTDGALPLPDLRRCDVTSDFRDPDRLLLDAALGWNPHARSRYSQGVHDDRGTGGHTVFQHNKTRGVRVYDKGSESGEAWALGVSRIEYQIRGDWLQRYGLDRLYEDFGSSADRAIAPVVADLLQRIPSGCQVEVV